MTSDAQKTRGWLLPDEITGHPLVCVQFQAPNHPAYRAAIRGALQELGRWWNWERDEAKRGRYAAKIFADLLHDTLTFEDCPNPLDSGCIEYNLDDAILEWNPNDPFRTPDLVPSGYAFPPWYRATAGTGVTLGTSIGDVVTDIARTQSIPVIPPVSGYPRLRIHLTGEGTVELHLVKTNTGGYAQITTDDNILSTEIVSLSKNVISIPPESTDDIIIERSVSGPGTHHIDILFIPLVNDELPFVGQGGAIRKIVLCGFDVPLNDLKPEFRTIVVDDCQQLQWKYGNETEWQNLGTPICDGEPGAPGECPDCEDELMALETQFDCELGLQYRTNNCAEWQTMFTITDLIQCLKDAGAIGTTPDDPGEPDPEAETKCRIANLTVFGLEGGGAPNVSVGNAFGVFAKAIRDNPVAGLLNITTAQIVQILGMPFIPTAQNLAILGLTMITSNSLEAAENLFTPRSGAVPTDAAKLAICDLYSVMDGTYITEAIRDAWRVKLEARGGAFADFSRFLGSIPAAYVYDLSRYIANGNGTGNLVEADCLCIDSAVPCDPDGTPTTTTYLFNNAAWTRRGTYVREEPGTPVGQFDSFELASTGGYVELTLPAVSCIRSVAFNLGYTGQQPNGNTSTLAGWRRARLYVDGVLVAADRAINNQNSCNTFINGITFNNIEKVGQVLRLEMTEQLRVGGVLHCAKVITLED